MPMTKQPAGMRRIKREGVVRDDTGAVIRADLYLIQLKVARKWVDIGWTERVNASRAGENTVRAKSTPKVTCIWRGHPAGIEFPQERQTHNAVMEWLREVYLASPPPAEPESPPEPEVTLESVPSAGWPVPIPTEPFSLACELPASPSSQSVYKNPSFSDILVEAEPPATAGTAPVFLAPPGAQAIVETDVATVETAAQDAGLSPAELLSGLAAASPFVAEDPFFDPFA